MKKKLFAVMCMALSLSMLTGCGGGTNQEMGDEKIEISVGYWPNPETDAERYAIYEGYIETFKQKRPDVTVIPDEMNHSNDTFMALAAAGQLPNIYRVPFTEPKNIINAGYARDITDIMKKRGYDKKLNSDLLDIVTVDGRYYGIPYNGYMMGMWYNVNLFEQAGLVNEDGSLKYPKTWEEVAETAKIITDKTGQPGFGFHCKDAEAGWNFMNIAWSYGVKFMEMGEDGKYTATFATKEMADALQFISDLKWKYNVIPANVLLSRGDLVKLFATDQVGMSICAEDWLDSPVKNYNMPKEKIGTSPMPSGPAGTYAETGGDAWLISAETTDEQLEALFDWLDVVGNGPELSDLAKTNIENNVKARASDGKVITVPAFSVWQDEERNKQIEEIYTPYVNTDPKVQVSMMNDKVMLHAEEPMATQELYRVVSSLMQEVLTNENVDIMPLLEEKQANFQRDFLD